MIALYAETRFQLWLEEAYPALHQCFDWPKHRYSKIDVNKLLDYADEGTTAFIQFVLGVWHHENRWHFDIIDAASMMSEKQCNAVIIWLQDPFWP